MACLATVVSDAGLAPEESKRMWQVETAREGCPGKRKSAETKELESLRKAQQTHWGLGSSLLTRQDWEGQAKILTLSQDGGVLHGIIDGKMTCPCCARGSAWQNGLRRRNSEIGGTFREPDDG